MDWGLRWGTQALGKSWHAGCAEDLVVFDSSLWQKCILYVYRYNYIVFNIMYTYIYICTHICAFVCLFSIIFGADDPQLHPVQRVAKIFSAFPGMVIPVVRTALDMTFWWKSCIIYIYMCVCVCIMYASNIMNFWYSPSPSSKIQFLPLPLLSREDSVIALGESEDLRMRPTWCHSVLQKRVILGDVERGRGVHTYNTLTHGERESDIYIYYIYNYL